MASSEIVFITNPWASGVIRGGQVSEKLGVPCDPKGEISADSIFVFVKATPNIVVERMYIDIVDAYGLLTSMPRFPHAKVIAISRLAQEYIANRIYNEVILIPEHHCNFENVLRVDRPVKTVGFCGYTPNFTLDPLVVKARLAEIGLDFVWQTDFNSREDVVEFYKTIDIQLSFRPKTPLGACAPELKNPLKLENAGSFKIPSVCCNEPSYVDEFDGCYLVAENLDEIVKKCNVLKVNSGLYRDIANVCWERAQNYHIDKILPLYKQLGDWELKSPTGNLIELEGFEIGDLKIFQIKDKDGSIVAQTKLVLRDIKIGSEVYKIGGLREFEVCEARRREGLGRMLFGDVIEHAKRREIDMLAGFAHEGPLKFYLKCGCGVLTGGFNGQTMFYYPTKESCDPKGPVDLMGTMW
jgi:GNAT superfamily N-acetyltransferase